MSETSPGGVEHASRMPRDLIIGLTVEESNRIERLTHVAELSNGKQWLLWGLEESSSRTPDEVRAYLQQDEVCTYKEKVALEAALGVGGIIWRLDPDEVIDSPDALRLRPKVRRAIENAHPAFSLFRERRYTVRAKGETSSPQYRRYMNSGLLVGLALYATRQS